MSLMLSGDAVDALREQFSGEVVERVDVGYDETRAIHNGLIDKRPALIARCVNAADVADAVRFARAQGLEISVRGGGHNVAGKAVTEGGVMVDLALMRGSFVDPARRRARVQGGATWNDYNRATHQHGLATTGGVISTTGVAGLTLGGGLGWLMGRFGMAVDNLTSVELVTANGDVLEVSADTEPELFWGLRGGGGNFGIAVSLEFEAHPLVTILGGIVAYPLAEALPVFAAYQEVTAEPPDELVSFLGLVHAPDGSGHKIVAPLPVCHSGDIATGEALVAPLRTVGTPAVDLIGPMPYPVINTLLDDAFPKGARNYWKSAFFKELSEDVIGVLVDTFERVPSPMAGMVIEHFHGAVTRIDPTATAYPHRRPGFNLVIAGEWLDPAEDDANIAWVRSTFEAVAPYTTDAVYVNYLADEPERVRAAYGPNWERLVALKRTWDPDNVFHLNQNIDPAG